MLIYNLILSLSYILTITVRLSSLSGPMGICLLIRIYTKKLCRKQSPKGTFAAEWKYIYCKGLYQERPLKILDWSNGTRLPLNVIVLELKFGLMVTVALLPPLVNVMKICAEIPIP